MRGDCLSVTMEFCVENPRARRKLWIPKMIRWTILSGLSHSRKLSLGKLSHGKPHKTSINNAQPRAAQLYFQNMFIELSGSPADELAILLRAHQFVQLRRFGQFHPYHPSF